MSDLHLNAGSDCPPATSGLLRCYSMKYCPYAQRTRLVLAAKNIEHEIVNVDLHEKPEWFFEKNPMAKVPTLELDGNFMYESSVTCDYLDEVYPDPALHPSDPWQKGKDRGMVELFNKVSTPMYKTYHAHVKGDKDAISKAFDEIKSGLEFFEDELKNRETKFFGGSKPGMLDYMIWPFGERLPVIEMIVGEELLENQFPLMKSWMKDMKEDSAVKSIYISPEVHKMFLEEAVGGRPNYDKQY